MTMETVLSPAEVALRLAAATLAGVTLGINRDLRGKPTGLRTLGLVCLGASLATVATVYIGPIQQDPDALSRVIQGVLQGVLAGLAFLGAGAVIRHGADTIGLTTAANVFVIACIGIACGLGEWWAALLGWAFAFLLLVLLTPVEKMIERLGRRRKDASSKASAEQSTLQSDSPDG